MRRGYAQVCNGIDRDLFTANAEQIGIAKAARDGVTRNAAQTAEVFRCMLSDLDTRGAYHLAQHRLAESSLLSVMGNFRAIEQAHAVQLEASTAVQLQADALLRRSAALQVALVGEGKLDAPSHFGAVSAPTPEHYPAAETTILGNLASVAGSFSVLEDGRAGEAGGPRSNIRRLIQAELQRQLCQREIEVAKLENKVRMDSATAGLQAVKAEYADWVLLLRAKAEQEGNARKLCALLRAMVAGDGEATGGEEDAEGIQAKVLKAFGQRLGDIDARLAGYYTELVHSHTRSHVQFVCETLVKPALRRQKDAAATLETIAAELQRADDCGQETLWEKLTVDKANAEEELTAVAALLVTWNDGCVKKRVGDALYEEALVSLDQPDSLPADIEGWLDTRDWQVRPSITGTGAPMIAATAASDAAGGGPA